MTLKDEAMIGLPRMGIPAVTLVVTEASHRRVAGGAVRTEKGV